MRFIKGESGNINGRPKGAVSKLTQTVKDIIDKNSTELLNLAINQCKNNPETSQALLGKLIDKFLPTLNKNENKNENTTIYDETLERVISEVKKLNKEAEKIES